MKNLVFCIFYLAYLQLYLFNNLFSQELSFDEKISVNIEHPSPEEAIIQISEAGSINFSYNPKEIMNLFIDFKKLIPAHDFKGRHICGVTFLFYILEPNLKRWLLIL